MSFSSTLIDSSGWIRWTVFADTLADLEQRKARALKELFHCSDRVNWHWTTPA